ncbi:hypothetical protein V6Z11_A05G145500 [Gossypium hirsutum]
MWRWSVEPAKSESNKAKKYFRMEFVDKEQEDTCKDLDFGALETVDCGNSCIDSPSQIESHVQKAALDWISRSF